MRERVAKARNGTGPQGGLFIPPAVDRDAVSMPGNQGGSNWGTTAANPDKGLVFVVERQPGRAAEARGREDVHAAAAAAAAGAVPQAGAAVFTQHCQRLPRREPAGCGAGRAVARRRHGADGRRRDSRDHHRRARPDAAAFPDISTEDQTALIAFLAQPVRGARRRWRRPWPRRLPDRLCRLVRSSRSGGVPQPPLPPRGGGPQYPAVGGNGGNTAYPRGRSTCRRTRYMSDYSVMAIVHEAAVHDADRVRPQHRRDQVAGAERRSSADDRARRSDRTPAASARATASSSPRAVSCSTPAATASCAPTTRTPARCCGTGGSPAARRACRLATNHAAGSTSSSPRVPVAAAEVAAVVAAPRRQRRHPTRTHRRRDDRVRVVEEIRARYDRCDGTTGPNRYDRCDGTTGPRNATNAGHPL